MKFFGKDYYERVTTNINDHSMTIIGFNKSEFFRLGSNMERNSNYGHLKEGRVDIGE